MFTVPACRATRDGSQTRTAAASGNSQHSKCRQVSEARVAYLSNLAASGGEEERP